MEVDGAAESSAAGVEGDVTAPTPKRELESEANGEGHAKGEDSVQDRQQPEPKRKRFFSAKVEDGQAGKNGAKKEKVEEDVVPLASSDVKGNGRAKQQAADIVEILDSDDEDDSVMQDAPSTSKSKGKQAEAKMKMPKPGLNGKPFSQERYLGSTLICRHKG